MNKLFSKIAALTLGLGLAVGVGVATGRGVQEVKAAQEVATTFTSKAWADSSGFWKSDKDGGQLSSGRGVQVTTSASGAGATSNEEVKKVSNIVFTYSTNASAGAGSISVTIGSGEKVTKNVTKTGGTTDRTLEFEYEPVQTGKVSFTVTCTTNSIYVKSISITYSSKETVNVLYNGNGNDSGTAPVDETEYNVNDTVTVLGNTGSLKKDTMVFDCWNTKADGSGTDYAPGATFTITDEVKLYAKWVSDSLDHIAVTGSMTKTEYLEGQNWSPEGLVVNAFYSDNTTKGVDITSDENLSWTFTPVKATDTSVTSVVATAHFGGKEASSEAQTVTVAEDNKVIVNAADELTRATTGVEEDTTYKAWSGKTCTTSAVYAGNSAGDNDSIQLRTKDSHSGIITTTSGGIAKKVIVDWQANTTAGRTLNVYGKSSAYELVTDLYDNKKQGTLLGSITKGTSTELVINDSYAFIAFRSDDGAMYISKLTVVWGVEADAADVTVINEFISANMHLDYTKNEGLCTEWYATAKAAFNAITNENAKNILLTSTSKYAKVTLNPDHKAEGDPETITYTYNEVLERLVAWAAANGEIFENGTFTTASNLGKTVAGQPGVVIIVVMATAAAISFGLIALLKARKKEN